MKEIIKNEFKGWKVTEVSWLVIACTIITALSIYWKDSVMGIISATTGVACVVLTGKGKLSAYLFGLINCILYAIISFKAHLYALYYVPMQFIGFAIWKKNMNKETNEVNKIHMKNKTRIICLLTIIISTFVYGLILKKLGDALPFVDAFTTVSSVVAMIISVKMYSEQWWIWILVDIFTVIMWYLSFRVGQENMATLLMWVVYLLNAIFMCIRWEKEIIKKRVK